MEFRLEYDHLANARTIVLSGPTFSGKTTLAGELVRLANARRIGVRGIIARIASLSAPSRMDLLSAGAKLEAETLGRWLLRGVLEEIASVGENVPIVIDSARTPPQLAALRSGLPRASLHIHVTADVGVRRARHSLASAEFELASFDELIAYPTERDAEDAAAGADLTIDTTNLSPSRAFALLMHHARALGERSD